MNAVPENDPNVNEEAALSRNRLMQIIPVALLGVLVLAAAINSMRGKNDQALEGVVVMDHADYRFYPGASDCNFRGIAYWFVPNNGFHNVAPLPTTTDFNRIESVFHAAWLVKFHGNLSPVGRYGYKEKYWRKVDVRYILDARILDCRDEVLRTTP